MTSFILGGEGGLDLEEARGALTIRALLGGQTCYFIVQSRVSK